MILPLVALLVASLGTAASASATLARAPASTMRAGWTGWSALPNSSHTVDAPRAVTFSHAQYVCFRGSDHGIYVNRLNSGSWSGWSEVPGNGLTPSGPGPAKFSGQLMLYVRGTDDQIFLNRLTS